MKVELATTPEGMLTGFSYHDGHLQSILLRDDMMWIEVVSSNCKLYTIALSSTSAASIDGIQSGSQVGWIFIDPVPVANEDRIVFKLVGAFGTSITVEAGSIAVCEGRTSSLASLVD